MALPLLDPLRDLTRVALSGAGSRATFTCLTALLGFFAGLLPLIGLPLTALVFACLFAAFALSVYLVGRGVSARHTAKILEAKNRATADIALAAALSSQARPLLPIAAFLAAFVLARRRSMRPPHPKAMHQRQSPQRPRSAGFEDVHPQPWA